MTPLEQIGVIADKFSKLPCDFAFLGGAVLSVLITDPAAPPLALRHYLGQAFFRFLKDARFLDALDGHLGFDGHEQSRKEIVLYRLREIASCATTM